MNLRQAIREGNTTEAIKLINEGAEIEVRDKEGRTPLHLAADKGNIQIVELLLDRGADIHAINGIELTPLHLATSKGHIKIVEILLDRGIDIHAINDSELTPLHLAAHQGHIKIVETLLDRGNKINASDVNKTTPLQCAASEGYRDVVKLLLDRGAYIHALNENGETALHKAAFQGNTDIVELLLDRRSDINAINNDERTPLHYAVDQNNVEIVSLIVEKGADIEAHTNNTTSPLQLAINKNQFLCTFFLLKGIGERFYDLTIPNNSLGAYLTEQYLIATSETNEKSESLENDEKSLIRVSMINCAKAIFGMETTDKAKALLKIKIGALRSGVKDPYINTLKFLYYFIRFGLSVENINHIIGYVGLYDAKVDLNDIMSDLSPKLSISILGPVVLKQTSTAIKASSITIAVQFLNKGNGKIY